jgi:predicted site-specific integrase-resolvase
MEMFSNQSTVGRYFTTAEVAERLRVCTKTLERWRQNGYGPRFLQLGKRALYSESSLAEWEAARTMSSRPRLARREEVAAA